jgi:hypothetical protein
MSSAQRETHLLAAFVHGALVALHTLGAVYNVRKRNHWHTVAHIGGIAFSIHSVGHHFHEMTHSLDPQNEQP